MTDSLLHQAAPEPARSAWREPWFWFVFTPLILVVLACIPFVYLAFNGADERVIDDYYTEGKAINHRFASDKLAERLGVRAHLQLDTQSGEVFCDLEGMAVYPAALSLHLSHPLRSARDQTFRLKKINAQRYRADIDQLYVGRWYVVLSPVDEAPDATWRLLGEMDLRQATSMHLQPARR
jgi:uncharacterized protein